MYMYVCMYSCINVYPCLCMYVYLLIRVDLYARPLVMFISALCVCMF